MNKKIIALATIIVLALASFIGYNVYQNSKPEKKQEVVEITDKDTKETSGETKTPTEEQKKDTEVVLDAEKAKATFEKFQNALFEIDYNDTEQVKKQEEILKEVVHPAFNDWVQKSLINPGKEEKVKLSLTSLSVDEIKEVGYSLDNNKYKGFDIIYSCIVDDGNKKQELKNKRSTFILDNNKYKIVEFNMPIEK